jgi:hypothetical protein
MKIKALYKDYFQKSRVFLYPALGIKRGVLITPLETYICWEGKYKKEDRKLICVYHVKDVDKFNIFDQSKLSGNSLFEKVIKVDEDHKVYIFNFDKYAEDWNNFLKGKYSAFSEELKKKVLAFYASNPTNQTYVRSFLYPESFHNEYAELLKVNCSLIKEVKELCDKPDPEIETCKINVYVSSLQK